MISVTVFLEFREGEAEIISEAEIIVELVFRSE